MRAIGIDPGLRNTGWAVVELRGKKPRLIAWGLIKTSGARASALQQIHQQLSEVLGEHRPQAAALESVFFGRNVSSAVTTGEARGVITLALLQHQVGFVTDYTPQRVKREIVGAGVASKDEMAARVAELLGLDEAPPTEHQADACGMAITLLREVTGEDQLYLRGPVGRRRPRALPEGLAMQSLGTTAPQLQGLFQAAFPEQNWTLAAARKCLKESELQLAVYREEDLVGFGALRREGDTARLHCLAAHPAWRSQGLGWALATRLLAEARSRGYSEASALIEPWRTPALALAKRLGLVEG